MKKQIVRILALMLALVTVFATTATAASLSKEGSAQTSISPLVPTKSIIDKDVSLASKAPLWNVSYNSTDGPYVLTESSSTRNLNGCRFPIHLPAKGQLNIRIDASSSLIPSSGVEIKLFNSSSLGATVDYGTFYSSTTKDISLDIPAAGDYYLFFGSSVSSYNPVNASVNFRTYFYSAANKTLTKGDWCACAPNPNKETRYYKFTVSESGNVTIYSDTSMSVDILNSKKSVKYSSVYLSDSKSNKAQLYLPKGTYYIKPASYLYDPFKLKFNVAKVSGSTFQLKNKSTLTVRPACSDSYMYLKYTATATGYVTLKETSENSAYVTLMNSARDTARSAKKWIYGGSSTSNKLVFGVKKGTTYYFKVTGTSCINKFYISQTAVSDKSGSSKSSAKSMAKGSTYKGLIIAGSKTADYYKFKLSSSNKIRIYLKGSATDKFKATVYNGSKTVGTYTFSGNGFDGYIYSVGKWPAGTYYVKVQRADTKSSGYYTIKWKTV